MARPDRESMRDERRWRTDRLESFSDGVFAIAVTLLVLEIGVQGDWRADPLRAVLGLWPEYLAYIVSFATIGAIWLGHSAVTSYLQGTDRVLSRVNLLVLLAVSFLPFPTKLLGQFLSEERGERVATTMLGLNLFLASLLLYVFWRTALARGHVAPDADDVDLALVTRRLTPGLLGYGVLIATGLAFPLVAVGGYLLVALALVLPSPWRRRRTTEGSEAAAGT